MARDWRKDQYKRTEAADWILMGPWRPDHDESELQDLPEAEPEVVRLRWDDGQL